MYLLMGQNQDGTREWCTPRDIPLRTHEEILKACAYEFSTNNMKRIVVYTVHHAPLFTIMRGEQWEGNNNG
jgi:hypothetical protein